MFLTFKPVHKGGRHMKVASVQSPVRQWTSLEKERRVGKPPTPQECNDVGEAARRQQEWTGQVETLTDRKRGGGCEGRTETSSVHLCCSASIPWRSLEAELLCCLISLGNSDASPQRRVTSGAVDPPLQQLKVRPPNRSQTWEGEPGFVVVCVVMAVVISDPSTGKYASRADNGNEANWCWSRLNLSFLTLQNYIRLL